MRYYYTDLSFVPLRIIWRSIRNIPVFLWLPVFALQLYHKITGKHSKPHYGIARPESLGEVDEKDLPPEVSAALQPLVEACESAGFHRFAYFHPTNNIGDGGARWLAVWLDRSSYVAANAFWILVRNVDVVVQKTSLVCTSQRLDGTKLITCALPPSLHFPDFSQSPSITLNLGSAAGPLDIIRQHEERVTREPTLIRFDPGYLRRQMLSDAQKNFDYQVERGYLRPLSEEDVLRLTNQSAAHPAKQNQPP